MSPHCVLTAAQSAKVFVSQQHTLHSHAGTQSPPPTKYTTLPPIGQKNSVGRLAAPPIWGFAKADRFLYGYGKPEQRPGPGSYALPPPIGAKSGSKPDPRCCGFGSATRDDVSKVFAEHARPADFTETSLSPGPAAYHLPTAIGVKQADGSKADPPHWSLGRRPKPSPPPGSGGMPEAIYSVPRAMGKQPDSRFRNQPAWGIKGRVRPPIDPGLASPGPTYELPQALSRQVSGHKLSAPVPSFTRASRWAAYESEQKRNTVPGPGAYG